MKADIQNRQDIYCLLESFYKKALNDETIGYFFTRVIKVSMAEHLLVITDFWEMVLFGGTNYNKNVIAPHMQLHKLSPLKEEHFNRWLALFEITVNELYAGPVATMAIQRALSIATVMKIKILHSSPIKNTTNDNTGSAAAG